MSIYEFSDYRPFLRTYIAGLGPKRRGELVRIASVLSIHTTTLSQIMAGKKDLSLDQGWALSKYLHLGLVETEYFIALVEKDRASTREFKNYLDQKMERLKKQSQDLMNRKVDDVILSDGAKGEFYSNWYYSAVRLITDLPNRQQPQTIAESLGLPLELVERVIEFLVKNGLCAYENGKLAPGPIRTHLDASSPQVSRHHTNWRLKAIEAHARSREKSEMFYTFPVTLSEKDAVEVQSLLAQLIKEVNGIIVPSPPESLYALNLDWFKVV